MGQIYIIISMYMSIRDTDWYTLSVPPIIIILLFGVSSALQNVLSCGI